MQKAAAAVLLALAVAASASAETTIAFHVRLTDGRTALLANPSFAELKLSDEQLQRAAKDRVLLLDHPSGTRWTWLMLSWLHDKNVEHGLNAAGGAVVGKDADVGLTPLDEHSVSVRCLHEQCELTVAGEKSTLKNGQSQTVAWDSDVRVAF
jgi:hypothetical protein